MQNKSCTIGKRHKWEHLCNRVFTSGSGRYRTVSLRGVYRCECGAIKKGEYVFEGL
jgi:hypothetical protein